MVRAQGLYTQGKSSDGMTKRQREVLGMLKGDPDAGLEPMSQLEVATALGVSRQRVRQIVEDLMNKGVEVPGAKPPPPKVAVTPAE